MPSREQFELFKVVRKLEIFRDLTEEEALHILELCQRRTYQAGATIWRAGDPGVDMLVLVTGKLHVNSASGDVVGQVLPGASFGEMACLTGHERYVGFEAQEPATAFCLSRDALRGLIAEKPTLDVKILETTLPQLAERVTRASTSGAQQSEDGQPTLW